MTKQAMTFHKTSGMLLMIQPIFRFILQICLQQILFQCSWMTLLVPLGLLKIKEFLLVIHHNGALLNIEIFPSVPSLWNSPGLLEFF